MASEYVYHWNRIFGALALLVVFLGAGAYGIASRFVSEGEVAEVEQPGTPPAAGAVSAEAAAPRSPKSAPATAGKGFIVAAAPASRVSAGSGLEPVPERASGSESEGVGKQAQVATDPSESGPPASVARGSRQITSSPMAAASVAEALEPGSPETGAPALEDPVREPGEVASEPALLPIADVPTPDPGLSTSATPPLQASAAPLPDRATTPSRFADQAPTSAERQDSARPTAHAVFEAGETSLYSPAVQRFSLANAVKNREPVAELKAVGFDENGLATAYAFSEVEGLMGSTLYYHWLHEGKKLAAVRIRVADERWRSHSSKYISEAKTGLWTVQLRNAEGELLAQTNFTLRRYDVSAAPDPDSN